MTEIVFAEMINNVQSRFLCSWGHKNKFHYHGIGSGLRVSHCREFHPDDYYLLIVNQTIRGKTNDNE